MEVEGSAPPATEGAGDATPAAASEDGNPPARRPEPEPPDATSRADSSDAEPPPPVVPPGPGARPVFERPEHVRGIYLNAWTAGSSRRLEQLLDLARRTEVNTFVIDVKDASGHVSHATGVELAREIGAVNEIRIHDLPGLLKRLESEGIYPIARIVLIKDPLLVEARPEMAVQDTAGGVWIDGKGIRWLNPFDERVWDYHLELAEEVVELGFPEIQWDYVRFPDAPRSELARATYPGREEQRATAAIRAFLDRSREELGGDGAVVTADVFGVTTSGGDVGIGQVWERFIDVVDVALPMVYPSHYWPGSFGYEEPNAHPYEIVREALERALARSAEVEGAGATRPWLQDFDLGDPDYGAPEVRAQIQAAYDVGIDEWLLWNPSSRYTEDALMPVEGWEGEPRIRVAGRVVPLSERHEALAAADSARIVTDDPTGQAAPDTTGVRPDTTGVRPDTTGGH